MFAKSLLVFLHGSGGNGSELRSYLENIPLASFGYNSYVDVISSELNISVFSPSSGVRRYSAAGGERMNVWYDRTPAFMKEGRNSTEDIAGINSSIEILLKKIHEKETETPFENYFIGGFSMGGGIALHLVRYLTESGNFQVLKKIKGIFTAGSFLVSSSTTFSELVLTALQSNHVSVPPILMMHGESDSLISVEWGKQTSVQFHLIARESAVMRMEAADEKNDGKQQHEENQSGSYDVQFRSYRKIDHELSEEEVISACFFYLLFHCEYCL
jgi:predicted esterase